MKTSSAERLAQALDAESAQTPEAEDTSAPRATRLGFSTTDVEGSNGRSRSRHPVRKRVPTPVLEMRGRMSIPRVAAAREGEPKCENEIGAAPAHLNAKQSAVWEEIKGFYPPNVLADVDRVAFEQLVVLVSNARAKRWKIPGSDHSRITTLLGLFGMTPADRSRVKVRQRGAKEKSAYDD